MPTSTPNALHVLNQSINQLLQEPHGKCRGETDSMIVPGKSNEISATNEIRSLNVNSDDDEVTSDGIVPYTSTSDRKDAATDSRKSV